MTPRTAYRCRFRSRGGEFYTETRRLVDILGAVYLDFRLAIDSRPFHNSFSHNCTHGMVIHSSYTSGSLLGPEWKHVQEWPMPRPPTASSSAHIHSNNAQAGPSNPRGRGGTQGQGDRERDMVDDMGRMDVNALSREDEEDEQWEYETEEEEVSWSRSFWYCSKGERPAVRLRP